MLNNKNKKEVLILTKMRNKNLMLIVLTIAMGVLISACSKEAPEDIVARVNKEDIQEEAFNEEYEIQSNLIEAQMGEGVLDQEISEGVTYKEQLKEEVLNSLILEELISQDASKKDIEVSEEEIDKSIEEMKNEMGGEEEYNKFLEEQNMDEEYIRNYTKKNILLPKYKANFSEGLELKDKELEKYFKENKDGLIVLKARQILTETEEEGNQVLKRLKDGEDFGELAKKESIDKSSAEVGGQLEPFQKGENEEFDEIVFNLKEGELSPLIKTDNGFHIVEVQERRDSFEELKSDLRNYMQEEKYVEHIQDLQNDAKIEVFLESDKDKK